MKMPQQMQMTSLRVPLLAMDDLSGIIRPMQDAGRQATHLNLIQFAKPWRANRHINFDTLPMI
jgi:hypothetical protein